MLRASVQHANIGPTSTTCSIDRNVVLIRGSLFPECKTIDKSFVHNSDGIVNLGFVARANVVFKLVWNNSSSPSVLSVRGSLSHFFFSSIVGSELFRSQTQIVNDVVAVGIDFIREYGNSIFRFFNGLVFNGHILTGRISWRWQGIVLWMSHSHSNSQKNLIHTRASLKESKGYPPPEKFSIEIPPLQEGYSLAKYSPPLENFRPILPPE